MTDHMSARNQRIEVITRGERRRRWSVEEKREIALESLEPGVSVSIVARRHGIGSGQLYTWRRQLLEGSLGPAPQPVAKFARVEVTAVAGPSEATGPAEPQPASTPVVPASRSASSGEGIIEISLPGGVSVRVDAEALACQAVHDARPMRTHTHAIDINGTFSL